MIPVLFASPLTSSGQLLNTNAEASDFYTMARGNHKANRYSATDGSTKASYLIGSDPAGIQTVSDYMAYDDTGIFVGNLQYSGELIELDFGMNLVQTNTTSNDIGGVMYPWHPDNVIDTLFVAHRDSIAFRGYSRSTLSLQWELWNTTANLDVYPIASKNDVANSRLLSCVYNYETNELAIVDHIGNILVSKTVSGTPIGGAYNHTSDNWLVSWADGYVTQYSSSLNVTFNTHVFSSGRAGGIGVNADGDIFVGGGKSSSYEVKKLDFAGNILADAYANRTNRVLAVDIDPGGTGLLVASYDGYVVKLDYSLTPFFEVNTGVGSHTVGLAVNPSTVVTDGHHPVGEPTATATVNVTYDLLVENNAYEVIKYDLSGNLITTYTSLDLTEISKNSASPVGFSFNQTDIFLSGQYPGPYDVRKYDTNLNLVASITHPTRIYCNHLGHVPNMAIDKFYIGDAGGYITAYSTSDLSQAWQARNQSSRVTSMMAYANEWIIAGPDSGTNIELWDGVGNLLDTYNFAAPSNYGSEVAGFEYLNEGGSGDFVGGFEDGQLARFSKSGNTISEVWVVSDFSGAGGRCRVLTVDSTYNVYAGGGASSPFTVRKFDANGNLLATSPAFTDRVVGLIYLDGAIFASSFDGTIKRFDTNLNEVWSQTPSTRLVELGFKADPAGNVSTFTL